MTLQEFYEKLKYAVGECPQWKFVDGKLRGFSGKKTFCPLTAVLYYDQQQYLPITLPLAAVAYLDLGFDVGSSIVVASDNPLSQSSIRQEMVKILFGLCS